MKSPLCFSLSFAALAASSLPLHAAVTFSGIYTGTVSEVNSTTQMAYTANVSNTDLLNGKIPATVGWNTTNEAHPNELTDGIHGNTYSTLPSDRVQGAWTTVNATAIYTLGLGANNLGYDLTSLQSIAAWNGAGFGNQAWTLAVRLVGSASYVNVATVDYRPLGTGNTSPGATKVELSNLNITGVEYLRVTANSAVNPNANAFVWRELDVTGLSTIPEPSSALLGGLGLLAMLRRRRS